MQVFVARQPIFGRSRQVVAYELLFRSGLENAFKAADGNFASQRVLDSSIHVFGLSTLTGGKPAFINFTKQLLLEGFALVLPPKLLVVELLETIEPDEDVIKACKELKRHGYTIALDDFALQPGCEPLVDIADIVKVDFLQVKGAKRHQVAEWLRKKGIRPLAEKIESQAEFEEALRCGYTYFQGFFFCKPEIVSGREIHGHKLTYLRLMQELAQSELDFNRLEAILKGDVSLSLKLLRYINSAAIGLRYPVTSLRQAMVLLGETNLRRWLTIALTASIFEDKPQELLVTGIVRGKFCELIFQRLNASIWGFDPFLAGFFSILDALLDKPLLELIDDLPLAREIKDALVGRPTLLGLTLKLVIAYEQAKWSEVSEIAERLKLREGEIPTFYTQALVWAEQVAGLIPSVKP